MSSQAPRKATYDDVLAAPDNVIAEVLGGVLYTQPRPMIRHQRAGTRLGTRIGSGFDGDSHGADRPGGWHLLNEPEVHLGTDILVPDLAGWRTSTLPKLPDEAFIAVAPDWVCEVLSERTRRNDRVIKMGIYRRERVGNVWLIEPEAKTLEVYRLDGETYRLLGTHSENDRVRAEPFDAIELDLSELWMA